MVIGDFLIIGYCNLVIMKISQMTNVAELISEYPESVEILIDYGIPCASCHFSSYDTLGDSIAEFGLEAEDVKDLLDELNELVEMKGVVNQAQNL